MYREKQFSIVLLLVKTNDSRAYSPDVAQLIEEYHVDTVPKSGGASLAQAHGALVA
jgi:hypothetical protein